MRIGKYIREQEKLAKKIVLRDKTPKNIKKFGGVDQAFIGDKVISGIVVLNSDMEVIEEKNAVYRTDFPYIPGLLSYREGPSIIKAYKKLKEKPDVLLIDGQGIAHQRGIGIASHIGVKLDVPTIGVAKSRLVGEYDKRKICSKLMYNGKQVGWVLRSKKGSKPIFISPGYRVSLKTSLKIVKKCLKGERLPEPTRLAHVYVNKVKKYVH